MDENTSRHNFHSFYEFRHNTHSSSNRHPETIVTRLVQAWKKSLTPLNNDMGLLIPLKISG